ncbi:MAG: helix-turn-helix domain-containing protein [Pyrinomonadaceae bacterium]
MLKPLFQKSAISGDNKPCFIFRSDSAIYERIARVVRRSKSALCGTQFVRIVDVLEKLCVALGCEPGDLLVRVSGDQKLRRRS